MSGYKVPNAKVAVQSLGFDVSIPHEEGIQLFAFHGRLNKRIRQNSDQDWADDIRKPVKGRWTYVNREVELKRGDCLYYWLTVRYEGLDYHSEIRTYTKGYFS